VVRFRDDTLLTPATKRPSHFTRNLNCLYGSKRCGLTKNCAIFFSSRGELAGDLLQLDDDEFGRFQRREADEDVDDAEVDVGLRRRLAVALDEVGFLRRTTLERALAEQPLHEGADVQADLRPQRFVVRLEHDPLRAAVEAL